MNILVYFPLNVCVYLCAWASLVAGKESACNARDPSSIPGSGRYTGEGSTPGLGRSPGGGLGNPLQYSCLENPHGQRSKHSPACICAYVCLDMCFHIHWNRIIQHNLISSPNNISSLTTVQCMDLQNYYSVLSLSIQVSSNSFNRNRIVWNLP